MNRILIVEDETNIARLIEMSLSRAGYSCTVLNDGMEAANCIEQNSFDLAILDIMLPGLDGYALLEYLRPMGTPVIFITAKSAVKDRVQGLRLGADDYLVKPFEIEELLARIRVLSRKRVGHKSNQFTVADLTLDVERRQVYRAGREIRLLPKEFSILECLMRGKGNVLSRRQIEDSIWNYDDTPSSNNVDVYISKLRKKIDGDSPVKLLHTIRGVGWVLREDGAAALSGQNGKEV